jgi:cysteine-S-conjugate beta-lyase
VHGSTVLYPTAEDLHAHRGEFQYGRHGTPTTRALQEKLMALEARNAPASVSRLPGLRRSRPP